MEGVEGTKGLELDGYWKNQFLQLLRPFAEVGKMLIEHCPDAPVESTVVQLCIPNAGPGKNLNVLDFRTASVVYDRIQAWPTSDGFPTAVVDLSKLQPEAPPKAMAAAAGLTDGD